MLSDRVYRPSRGEEVCTEFAVNSKFWFEMASAP
jgi:hypothetical protein